MQRSTGELNGTRVFAARRFADERGTLLQSYTHSGLEAMGIRALFKQAIQSRSKRGVVRGLHFQWNPLQGKLVRCVTGAILDVVVDVRPGSPTLGDHAAMELSEENGSVLWVPPGFAHGFMALAEDSIVYYECTAEWAPAAEGGILWCDPALGINWPAIEPTLSEKDRKMPTLAQWLADPRSAHFRMQNL
ncbi:MAG: dTDP-4-dehydrorhamnose 3,5-epimerase [Acidobacteriia bacterium]|nr:dTDP-4-dehydrorhamnose 3,5-epimerase [Terriglobia bacterium]